MLRPIKASEWFTFTDKDREILKSLGAVPVNDVFYPFWNNHNAINLYFGGYGSGKSVGIAQELIEKCLTTSYFKCYFGRKVYDDIRESVFATIHETIEDMGVQHKFHYSTAQTSSMVITCSNGNKFIPFGSKDPNQLKSIKDPTHFWCEEFDQYFWGDEERQADFALIYPRLRTQKAVTQFYGSFNTASVFPNHGMLKYFFPELYTGDDKAQFDILEGIDIHKLFANYTDNHFIDREKYYQQLRLASGGNSLILDAIAKGEWGAEDNKNPWLYGFDVNKHVAQTIPFLSSFPVYVSFDFNNDPFACTCWQMSPHKGMNDSFIHCIREFSGTMKVEEMCQRIRSTFPASVLYITGDRSGQNEDVGRNQTLYQMIAAYLGVSQKLLNLNTTNLEHADSRFFLNAMYANYPHLIISREGCPNLVRQCQMAKVDTDNKKPSQLLKDRENHKNDEFDSMRYFFQTYFHQFAKDKYFKAIKK
jgi:phage terminase large subunit